MRSFSGHNGSPDDRQVWIPRSIGTEKMEKSKFHYTAVSTAAHMFAGEQDVGDFKERSHLSLPGY